MGVFTQELRSLSQDELGSQGGGTEESSVLENEFRGESRVVEVV